MPLELFRQEISFNPFHFFGLANRAVPVTDSCNTIVGEYAWQSMSAAGRHEIRENIQEAQARLTEYLGYPLQPTYITERHAWTGGPIVLRYGKVLALGTRSETLLSSAAVVLSSTMQDGAFDTFTLTVATSVTDASSIIVKLAGREIAPVSVLIAGGVATITGRAWLIVRPDLYERYTLQTIDPNVAGNFAATLDVYNVTTDSAAVATFDANNITVEPNTILMWSFHENGIVYVHSGCAIERSCTPRPTHVTINYLAGDNLDRWKTAITRYALAEMPETICACEVANKVITRWQRDMTSNNGDANLFQLRTDEMSNPFGTRLGHMHAWTYVQGQERRRVGLAV